MTELATANRGLAVLSHLICVACIFLLLSCSSGIYHTVKPGQTLYRISRVYDVDEAVLARVNWIENPAQLRAGTRLYIPGAERVKYVPVVKSTPATKNKITSVKPVRPVKPAKPVQSRPTVKKSIVAKPVPKVIQKSSTQPRRQNASAVKKLHWPVRGKIVRTFSPKAKAGSGKGVEIAVRSGSEVRAAEAGKVIYSGDGVKGYGHLIILQHENDLFTVYGFNNRNLVRQGDFVSQGEKVAISGVPPAGGKARLHFEVRKGKVAVDPILYLP